MGRGNRATVGAAAAAVLETDGRRLAEALRRLEARGDAEDVHDVRVACRRLRTALRTLSPYGLRGVEALRRRLRGLAGALGPLRDDDVLAGAVRRLAGADSAAHALADLLSADRPADLERARRRARRDGPTLLRSIAAVGRRAEGAVTPPMWVRAPAVLHRRWRAVADHAATVAHPAEAPLHALRIAAKRLRYVIEGHFGERGKPLAARAEAIQDLVGAVRDASLAEWRLGRTAHPLASRIARRLHADAEARLRSLPLAFRRVAGADFLDGLRRLAAG